MIHTRPIPHRFEPVTKSGIIAWEEGCLRCAVCVKKQCIYNVYDSRDLNARQMVDSIDNQCMNCFRCVQNCPKELISKSLNPEFQAIGDSHWTPDIIARLWYQAETGKIPVSGAGYPGPFSGPGFDSMWTDMSEIVRPTRDGIHGREYISTAMDIGRTPRYLTFSISGEIKEDPPNLITIPIPVMMRIPQFGSLSEKTIKGWGMATKRLGTFLAVPQETLEMAPADFHPYLIPVITRQLEKSVPRDAIQMIEVVWTEDWKKIIQNAKKSYPSALVSARLPMIQGVEEKIFTLLDGGCSVIHLEGLMDGKTPDEEPRFLKDGIRSVHLALVEQKVRDEITIFASGGLATAEHVSKAILCGADAVFIDFPVLIALECRMCRRCEKGLPCPVEIEEAPSQWVAARTINLLGAWHNQLLEVMGAMGIRDVRRLRGDVGRAMFFEDLDKDIFGSLRHAEEGYDLE
jgi:ferredoxin